VVAYNRVVGELGRAFSEALGSVASGDVDTLLASRIADARRAWPDFAVDALVMAKALGELARRNGSTDVPADEAVIDLHLALACAAGNRAAMEAFEQRYFGNIDRAVACVVRDGGSVDDVRQRVRERLFVADAGGIAPVVEYAGRGDLRRLVDVAALRIALNLRRGDERRLARDGTFASDVVDDALDDPELGFIKQTYRVQLKAAFERAIASLQARERNLLRYHLLQHLGIDQLGVLYGVHRSTAARWLAAARATVAERVRAELTAELADESVLHDAIELARSRLDLSLSRVLATQTAHE
jgi:RNA polymerase sigma-70 factor (ECF subfamily)